MNKHPLPHYPIFLDLKARRVIVIGGGAVAERKVGKLINAGADVTVISPVLTPALIQWKKQQRIKIIERPYRDGDLHLAALAFTATDHPKVNQAVAAEARKEQVWLNVADRSAEGDFIVPALFSETDFTVAVSTGGRDPALAVKLRDRIKTLLTQAASK